MNANAPLAHPRALDLRRLVAAEPVDPAVARHLADCEACRERVEALRAEQRRFEAAVPFERFASGVEAAARVEAQRGRAERHRRFNPRPLLALAAGVVVVVAASLLWPKAAGPGGTHLKGGAQVEVVVAAGPTGAQRLASVAGPEALGPGERVRIGVVPASWHFVLVVSLDADGTVTPVYASPEGWSLPLSGQSPEFLPDSLEFTGAGLERVVVVLSDRALQADVVASAARRAYGAAGGDLTRLESLDVPGEQFHRVFLKP